MEAEKHTSILYVEDNELNQLIIKKMLNTLGYQHILIAGDATQAITLLENPSTSVDLILMDLGLPGMDGITLTEKIRQSHWQARDVPIIAVTGNEEAEAKVKTFAAGMNDFLMKPVDKNHLGLTLKKFLNHE